MKEILWKGRVPIVVYGAAIPVAILTHYAYKNGIAKHVVLLPTLLFAFALIMGVVRDKSQSAAEVLTITLQICGAALLAHFWPGIDAFTSFDFNRIIPWEFVLALYVLLTIAVGAAFKPRIVRCFG